MNDIPISRDIDGVSKIQYSINLETTSDITDFVDIAKNIPFEVILTGKDENGMDWRISAKSLLATAALFQIKDKYKNVFDKIDYNQIYCLCEKDIYTQIQKYVKG